MPLLAYLLFPVKVSFLIVYVFPLLRLLIRKSFRITPRHYEKAVAGVSALLNEVDGLLADGRRSILGGDGINYTDITFCAILGLAHNPPGFGGGRADSVRIAFDDCPGAMREEISRWRSEAPRAFAFIDRLYREERL